ncbi:MAG: TonB-dependent receptor [Bacteroidota bacterium]|nr:TonB-dependent receptor [Bacteroidota bacterium]
MLKINSFTSHPVRFVVSAVILLYSFSVAAADDKNDTLHTHVLKEVKVTSRKQEFTRASIPVQRLDEKELNRLNADNVTDAAKHFAGITVKDYGGIGGLKTVSVRGMGAQQTGVSYDGVMLSDIQSGQIDLGRFSLENISEISLSNGQPNELFQTARMFASSGVLSLTTKLPEYDELHPFSGRLSLKTGSFGLLNPSVFFNKSFGRKWVMSFSTDVQVANGAYKFRQYYGTTANQSQLLTRTNSDVQSIRSEINAMYRLQPNEDISCKMNFFDSERGLPDGVTYYNSYNRQRLWDTNYLSQLHYENKRSTLFQYQFFGRFNSSYNKYRDIDPKYTGGILTDHYLQHEYYVSSSFLYRPIQCLSVSGSADWWYNNLFIDSNINFKKFVFPTRNTGLANIAAKYETDRLNLGGNLLYTLTREQVRTGIASPNRDKVSPSANLSYKILDDKELRMRFFYKNIFRIPTFNDLYYQEMGNPNLRPENTNQYNLGLVYREVEIPFLSELEVSADAYYNQVTDKIIALPSDLFHWSMTNKGKVAIKGCDITLKAGIPIGKTDHILLRGNYTFQLANDVTPGSANYDEQIPYTPVHSGSGSIIYQHKILECGYNLIFSGERWSGQNIEANKLVPYQEHSIFGTVTLKKYKFRAEIINILNAQYEVVKFYPMPGINYRITLSMNL